MNIQSQYFTQFVAALAFVLNHSIPIWAQSLPDTSPTSSRLGINLAGPEDWATELPFVDVFRTARPWISQAKRRLGPGTRINVDEFGWVEELQPGCYAEAMLCTISGGPLPIGNLHGAL